MKPSSFSRWSLGVLCFLCLPRLGEANVNTVIQVGPLFRVVNSRLSISCNTSGFINKNTQKDFEIRMKDPARPTLDINVISTQDPHFSYSRFSDRVKKQEISITQIDPNSIIFEIKNLIKKDEGEYECTVINQEKAFIGTYSAKTAVKVIDNSLSVTSTDSTTSLSYNVGEALTLTCQASTDTIQHVHLSFAWYLRKDAAQDAEPIISLNSEFTLTPGQGFKSRYSKGAIRLDKLGEATYRLQIAELELSDQGQIYCQAQEWIQDPDRSWHIIAQRDAREITLTVKPKVVTDTSSMDVSLTGQNALHEGQELVLSCGIDALNLQTRFFSVAWLWEETELAKIGPTGILTVREEYIDQEKDGELRATRTGVNNYQLRIKPVRTMNGGNYICRAWMEERGDDETFNRGAAQDSHPLEVKVTTPESGLSVKMQKMVKKLSPKQKLSLLCTADGVKGQLSVSWQRKLTQSPLFTNIISLSENGVTDKVEAFAKREVRVTRPTTESFVFELDDVAESDSGTYQCTVHETLPNGNTQSQMQNATVDVTPIESLVKVILKSRDPVVTVGNDVVLICNIKSTGIPMTLTWSLQTEDSNLYTILVLYSNGSISWTGDQHRYQVEVDNQGPAVMHYLKILGASHREEGNYQCRVSLFLQNGPKKIPVSNLLRVNVKNPESQLAISSDSTITQSVNTDIKIGCNITKRTSDVSLFTVTWELQQEAGKTKIISSDRNAVITFGSQLKKSDRQRISVKCTEGPYYELTIQHGRISDSGRYVCKVMEYLQDPNGEWYPLLERNSTTTLEVTEIENNLSIESIESEQNVSREKDFSIPCNITHQSSEESQFQVTWFWQKGAEAKPIFTAYRNSTFQASNLYVKYVHPLPRQFSLEVLSSNEEKSGSYFCEVEEWLYSLAYGWRKIAVEKSGHLNVTVVAEGNAEAITDPECMANIWMAVFIVTSIIFFCIALILIVKMSKKKTPDPSFWSEQRLIKTND